MAVYSMTGFGSSTAGGAAAEDAKAGTVIAELRSVNGRFLDLVLRLPDELRALEPALRELMGSRLRRGKVELRLTTRRESDAGWLQPTPEQMSALNRVQTLVTGWLPDATPLSVNEALQWCRTATSSERFDDGALAATGAALDALVEARAREGARLVGILRERVEVLRGLAARAGPLVPAVVQRQQERFLERWNDALSGAGAAGSIPAATLQERALGEAAAFAIRIDVAEELTRLQAHLQEIDRLLERGGEIGKRLDFLIQELHREANTLGSKSAALELTTIAVDMKVAIEQMREQVQNIE